uniref:phospholipase D family protein n=1 Tax=Gordonia sp. B7-2 TaxID=3420932 RepID=UPI003D8AE38F
MSVTFEFSSPLTLIREWRDSGENLTEALILGYTIDLPFLERYFIGQARGIGARVTVLSDVHQSTHDDVDVRKAGRSYLHGQVLCAGAFHPKLTVLLNEERVWIAIGSGNPTTSGWGHNAELWLVVRSSSTSGPAAFYDLAQWLEDLPHIVHMPSWIGESVENVARQIRPKSTDQSAESLQFLGNLRRSLISQLPIGPTADLNLSAPFLDPKSNAVASLVERFQPQRIAIGIQPTLGSYDGRSLADALAAVPAYEIRYLDETRTSHGKLVEWTAGGEWRALVGSPNLSAAALLRATNNHGNCELAAIYDNSVSLLPEGSIAAAADLRARRTISDAHEAESDDDVLTLLGVKRSPGGIDVEFVVKRPARVAFDIANDAGPGDWHEIHTVDVDISGGVSEFCPYAAPAGYAMRIRTELDDTIHISRVVFVTDLHRCQPRVSSSIGPKLARDYGMDSLFGDDDLANRFRHDFTSLVLATSRVGGGGSSAAAASVPAPASESDDDRWATWIAKVEDVFKPSLTGLLFPTGVDTATRDIGPGWTIDPDEGVDIADGEDEEAVDPLEDEFSARQARTVTPIQNSAKTAWKKWDTKLRRQILRADPPLPIEVRLLALRLHLDLLAAGVWGPSDKEWTNNLLELIAAVYTDKVLPTDLPEEVDSTRATLVANAFALLFDELKQVGGNQLDLLAQESWAAVSPQVARARDEDVAHHLLRPGSAYGRIARAAAVEDLVKRARDTRDDPAREKLALLDSIGFSVELRDGAWVADIGESRNTRWAAARIAEVIGQPCCVIVVSDHGTSCVIWVDKDIAHADSRTGLWKLFRVKVVGGPSSTISGPDGLTGACRTWSLRKSDHEVEKLSRAAGVDSRRIATFFATAND